MLTYIYVVTKNDWEWGYPCEKLKTLNSRKSNTCDDNEAKVVKVEVWQMQKVNSIVGQFPQQLSAKLNSDVLVQYLPHSNGMKQSCAHVRAHLPHLNICCSWQCHFCWVHLLSLFKDEGVSALACACYRGLLFILIILTVTPQKELRPCGRSEKLLRQWVSECEDAFQLLDLFFAPVAVEITLSFSAGSLFCLSCAHLFLLTFLTRQVS